MTIYDYGIDLNSSFTFKDGDISLSQYEDNLVQAIQNRLNTDLDEMDLFYEDYGSVITGFCGWKRRESTLSFIKLEVDKVIAKDPRIPVFKTELSFNNAGAVVIELTIYPAVLTVNFVLTNNGVEIIETEEE